MSQFLPASQLNPGGLKGRDTLDEPGRRKHRREQRDRGAQRVLGVERAEGFLRLQAPYDLLSEHYSRNGTVQIRDQAVTVRLIGVTVRQYRIDQIGREHV